MMRVAAGLIALALASCGAPDDEPPAKATVGEKEALEDAAEMIESRPIPADALADEVETGSIEPSDAPPIAEETTE